MEWIEGMSGVLFYGCLQVKTDLVVHFLSSSPGFHLLPQELACYSDLSSHSCLLFEKELLFTLSICRHYVLL